MASLALPTFASGLSLRWLVALIAAIVLPIVLFAVTVSLLLDRQDRSSIERELHTVARAASAAVNVKLASEVATLETIAAAIDLPEGVDAPALSEARRVIEAEPEWLGLRLTDPVSGRTIVHLGNGLGREPGAEPGKSKAVAGVARRVGRVIQPDAADVPAYVPIQVPIVRNNRISYFLTAFVRAAAFGDVLDAQSLPAGWIAGILDIEDNLVGRNRAAIQPGDIGLTAMRSVAEQIKQSSGAPVFDGWLLGRATYFAVRHSEFSDWTTFVGVPAEVVEVPLYRHRAVMIAAGLAALLLTLLLAGILLRSAARLREEQALVRQKDVLLREINHRIKNNLQVIASLISLQADRAQLPETRRELGTIARRVRALNLVHEQLHPALTDGAIDLASYLESLCANLPAVHGHADRRVRVLPHLQSMMVKADAAVPVGLIVSEALTNSLKHAFPYGSRGTVQITLERAGPDRALLELADDGIGLPDKDKLDEGVGLNLIEALAAQTGGELGWSRDGGTTLRLSFPLEANGGSLARPSARPERDSRI
jgi:two-component sensor histidine kinase